MRSLQNLVAVTAVCLLAPVVLRLLARHRPARGTLAFLRLHPPAGPLCCALIAPSWWPSHSLEVERLLVMS